MQESGFQKNDLAAITITALICLTIIEIFALHNGIDGALLGAVTSVFGAIIGAVAIKIKGKT